MRPDVRQAYIESWGTHANRDRTVERTSYAALRPASAYSRKSITNHSTPTIPIVLFYDWKRFRDWVDQQSAVEQVDEYEGLEKGPANSTCLRNIRIPLLQITTTATEKRRRRPPTLTAALGCEAGPITPWARHQLPRAPRHRAQAGGATGSSKSSTKADDRDRTPSNLLALGKMSDLPRNAEPQMDDQQAIRVIRDRGIKKMLRNASGPNYFTKKGELYADVRFVTNIKGEDGELLLTEAQRKSAVDTVKVKSDLVGDQREKVEQKLMCTVSCILH
ncbi:hypothetical protein LTR27_007361 [Elasticomyces elasticus]|nr:hypothetical protein LTR27_007361 [Elasticomyces elasticus]